MTLIEPKFKIGQTVYWEILSSLLLWSFRDPKGKFNYQLTDGSRLLDETRVYPYPDDIDDSSDPILLMRGMGIVKDIFYVEESEDLPPAMFLGEEYSDQIKFDLTTGGWVYLVQLAPCVNPNALLEVVINDEVHYLKGEYGRNLILDYLNYSRNAVAPATWFDERYLFPASQTTKPDGVQIEDCFFYPDPDSLVSNLYFSKLFTRLDDPVTVRDYALPPCLFSIPDVILEYGEIVTVDSDLMEDVIYE